MSATTTYTVSVPCATTWATGSMRSSTVRHIEVEEEASILGGLRAIDAAVAQCEARLRLVVLTDYSPDITPNPALLGWPLGTVRS